MITESAPWRETHISRIYRDGDTIYKVKKPVRFPFVDYGTVERRRAACHAEIELNRRFASDLYRGVVGLAPGFEVVAEDDPRAIEYAVEMRRYDESATLAARLASASESDLDAVGAAVARFHAAAPVADHDGLPGVVEETLATLAQAGAPGPRIAALDRFCRAAMTHFAPELARRARTGHVRDGHGDLRAEHILLGDRVEAVDGVEFDPGLRIADVGYDLAFLVMDVARRDGEFARALVRGYRAAGGDPGSNGLLDFFCTVRALVRAKVDLLRAAQLTGADSQERSGRAWELLALAERFAWRVRLPLVACVVGLAASGKSTVAGALAAAAGRPILSSDRIRKFRAGVGAFDYAGAAAYGDSESRAVYTELAQRAAHLVRGGGGVIVDATFRRTADADTFASASSAARAAGWIVCEAPHEVRLERAAARALRDSISDAGPAVIEREAALYSGPFKPPGIPLARLDTTQPTSLVLEQLAEALDARLGGAT
jgi:aminoglycoside phosphotransferase family enzyme/predicted kinase